MKLLNLLILNFAVRLIVLQVQLWIILQKGLKETEIKNLFNFISIAKASCGETRSQLYRVFDRNFISQEKFETLKEKTEILRRKIGSFIKYLNITDLKGTKYKS